MRQMDTELEELDFGTAAASNGNLARKADIMQYSERAGRSHAARNTYSGAPRHNGGEYAQSAYRQTQHRQPARTQGQQLAQAQPMRSQAHPAGSRPVQGRERQPEPAARRNPYLVNMRQEAGRGPAYDTGRSSTKRRKDVDMIWGEEVRRPSSRAQAERYARPSSRGPVEGHARPSSRGPVEGHTRPASRAQAEGYARPESYGQGRSVAERTARAAGQPSGDQRRRMLQEKRRKAMMKKKIIMGAVELVAVFCIAILVYQGFFKEEKPQENLPVTVPQENMGQSPIVSTPGDKVQGIDAEIFAKHPEWEENFLTPNEYSRPGDPLTQVNNIFVHYTANPNTSAKQNRSYFEQQKDTHERSVSAHFIIGYNGEIMQIVPLDEIAYAVMTRNEDSISIECCYKAENGQFTQETYDSLISLLSWLTEAYNLDTEDILRHYDCGGKKCPLYYTEHEDAWDKLKKDVKDYTL